MLQGCHLDSILLAGYDQDAFACTEPDPVANNDIGSVLKQVFDGGILIEFRRGYEGGIAVEITDGIAMKASDGPTFQAEKGRYVAKDRRIFASGSIRASKEDYILTANELETDDQFETITVKGNARIVKGGPKP